MQSAVLLKSNRGAGGGRRSVNGARKVPRGLSLSLLGDDEALNTLKVVRKFDTQKRRRGEVYPDFSTKRTNHQRHRQWFKMTGGR